MSCTTCGNNQNPFAVYNVQYIYKNDCADCANSGCETTIKAGCVFYTSANLPNSGILTNDSLEVALQKIDTILASVAGDYSTYNINCLNNPGTITTEAQFVDEITSYVCALNVVVDTFISTTYPADQVVVDNRFNAIESPGIVCASAGIVDTDTLTQVYTKYCNKFTDIDIALDISAVDWDQCFTVITPPTTIAGGFDLLIDQICEIKTGGGITLPVFNNIGSVLASPGATDSLESTVIKLRDRINLVPTFNINTLSWNCISQPSVTNIDLQAAFAAVLAKLDAISQAMPTFDAGDFAVTNVDNGDLCLGKNIALQVPLDQDRFVASNVADTSPGTLIEKLLAGTNITLDDTTTPGKIIINSSGGGSDAFTVKASSLGVDGFLDAKITGDTNDGITIAAYYDGGLDKIVISPSVETDVLVDSILTLIENDSVIRTRLCTILSSCPSPCSAPQNPQVVAI